MHYVGYSKKYDEWKRKDLVILGDDDSNNDAVDAVIPHVTYSLYQVIGNKIKLSLNNERKVSPCVRINIPFNKVMFERGLAKIRD